MDVVVVGQGNHTGGIACGEEQVVCNRGTERRDAPPAQIGEAMNPAGVSRSYREHFAEFEIRNGHRVSGAAHGGVLDAREAEREVAAFNGLVDAGPLHLDEPSGAASQATRDAVGDLDVEAAHARGVGGISLDERGTTLGVAAPHQNPGVGMLLCDDETQCERRDHAVRATACNQRFASTSPAQSAGPTGEPR